MRGKKNPPRIFSAYVAVFRSGTPFSKKDAAKVGHIMATIQKDLVRLFTEAPTTEVEVTVARTLRP